MNDYNETEECIADMISNGYHYLDQNQLESLLDKTEDLITILKRAIRDKEKYR